MKKIIEIRDGILMINNISINYHKCECNFCKKYNSEKGYFNISDNHKKLTTHISVLVSVIQNNEFRFMFFMHIITYGEDLIENRMYERMLRVVLKGEISETRMVGVDKKRN